MKSLFNTFLSLKLTDSLKPSVSKRSAEAYYTPYQGYSQEDAQTSLEQEQMGDQMKDMLRSLYSTFIDLNLENTVKQSAQSAMAAFNQGF